MKNEKTAILLINVGSPDKPTKKAVQNFLFQFLNDKRVIDLPWLFRILLVNLIIIPFRVKKSTKLYQRLFNENGSPLIYHTEKLKSKLQKRLGEEFEVLIGMRYGNPGYKKALAKIKAGSFKQLILFPLFPQHAMSTTETAFIAINTELTRIGLNLKTVEIQQFYNHPKFIKAFAEEAKKYNLKKFDHVLFSYHGLPNRQIEKGHPGITVNSCDCTNSVPEHGKYCYRANCYATSRLIAKELKLEPFTYSTSFQSRLSKNWLNPFSDDVLLDKLKEGKKNILVLAPSFVTDCLETIIEIGEDYQNLFINNGGESLQLVTSLNDSDLWIEALTSIINDTME